MINDSKYLTPIEKAIEREKVLSRKDKTVGLTTEESVEWQRLCEDLSDYLENT